VIVDETGLPEARLAATSAAITGDSGSLYHLVSRLMDEGMPFDTILFDVLIPTEKDVGSRWQAGDYLISEEHAATATVETVISLLVGTFDQPETGSHLVVAAVQGDHHSLPARAVAAHLLYVGYRTTFLGANVLASDLREYLEIDPPEALILSCAMATHLLGARAAVRAGHEAGVPVMVGGKAFGATGSRAALVGADAWVPSPREVPAILASWVPDITDSEAGAMNPSDELTRLIEQRTLVLAAAQTELASTGSWGNQARLFEEQALLLSAVEASMQIEDDSVIEEMIHWQQATLGAHGFEDPGTVARSLQAALAGFSATAAAALTRSMLD
jgi:methanogenic corrinoid protein MtbC1